MGLALVAVAALPPLAPLLTARLATHVLGQYPLIVAGGALIGARLALARPAPWTAAPALLAAVLTLAFWLLPRWIDAAVADPAVAAAKAASLALLAGVPLGWGWAQAGPVLRGFLLANVAAMLAVMGWLQLAVPTRLCNSYLASDQEHYGKALIALALIMIGVGLARTVFGNGRGAEIRAREARQ